MITASRTGYLDDEWVPGLVAFEVFKDDGNLVGAFCPVFGRGVSEERSRFIVEEEPLTSTSTEGDVDFSEVFVRVRSFKL